MHMQRCWVTSFLSAGFAGQSEQFSMRVPLCAQENYFLREKRRDRAVKSSVSFCLFENFFPGCRVAADIVFDVVKQNMLCIVNRELAVVVDIGCAHLFVVQAGVKVCHFCNICIQRELCILNVHDTVQIDISAKHADGRLCGGCRSRCGCFGRGR